MTVRTASRLVPITRALLKEFYAGHPFDPIPDTAALLLGLRELVTLVGLDAAEAESINKAVYLAVPHRLDDCFWRSRQCCEEAAEHLGKVAKQLPGGHEAAIKACAEQLLGAAAGIQHVQQSNTEAAAAQVKTFLPQDFRASLLESRRVATEARYKKQVEDLLKRGGSIRDKYQLYLQQQWERREAVVQMGTLSGPIRIIVKYVGGVPQVLLDFAKQINEPLGPLEEQRLKYGPDFYVLCELGAQINVAAAQWAAAPGAGGAAAPEALRRLQPAVDFYCMHLQRLATFLGDLFIKSPFFVTEEAAKRGTTAALTDEGAPVGVGAESVTGLSVPSMATATETAAVVGTSPTARAASVAGSRPHSISGAAERKAGDAGDGGPGAPALHCADALLAAVGLHGHSAGGAGRSSYSRTSSEHLKPHTSDADGHTRFSFRSKSPPLPGADPAHGGEGGRSAFADAGAQARLRVMGDPHPAPPPGPGPPLPNTLSVGSATDFFSCADNMSWASSTHYQSWLVGGEDGGAVLPDGVSSASGVLTRRSGVLAGHPGAASSAAQVHLRVSSTGHTPPPGGLPAIPSHQALQDTAAGLPPVMIANGGTGPKAAQQGTSPASPEPTTAQPERRRRWCRCFAS